jgi:ribosomal protein S18 acetylase RimI-like enzyme
MKLIIRRYEPQDIPRIHELHILALKKVPNLIIPDLAIGEDLQDIDKGYIDNGGDFLVVEDEGKIIGMGALRRKEEGCGEIRRMRVDPQYWRKGIGQWILSKLEEIAREKKYSRLVLDTSVHQLPAQKLYQKNNYKEIRREEIKGIECIVYEKEISA